MNRTDHSWQPAVFEAAVEVALTELDRYLRDSEQAREPVVVRRSPAELADRLDLRRWIAEGGMDPGRLGGFLREYLANSTRLHHPGYLAHQNAVPHFPAAVADLVQGATNSPVSVYEMGPAGATVELAVLDWMLGQVGWDPATGGGVLTHGGSAANLTALLAARAQAAPDSWADGVPDDLVLLAPPSAHYSLRRAAAILGLGERAVYPLVVDGLERIVPAALEATLAQVRAAGKRPMALVANAGATSTGLHDDLVAVGEFCRRHRIWFHVDGAHGASALLAPELRHLLAGVRGADSLVWDAHKMLRVAGLCAGVLLRDRTHLMGAFRQRAEYLLYGDPHSGVDLMERSLECSKSALGLRLFLNLAWHGEAGLGEYVARRYRLAREFHALISARPGFECPYPPESNILCFRYRGSDQDQVDLRQRLLAQGRFHLSSTTVAGRRYLRLVVMSPTTTAADIQELLTAVERAG